MVAGGETSTHSRKSKHSLTDVLCTNNGLEYSVHKCPRQYYQDIKSIFPSQDPKSILIISTCQHSEVDLVKTGEVVENEKDRLLERFTAWAKGVCSGLINEGHFADYLDPASGLPMIHKDTTTVYSEVDALSTLLGYPCVNAGCCKVVLHPKWGSSVYPASLFTTAPLEVLLKVFSSQP